jgi:hypothetical protein
MPEINSDFPKGLVLRQLAEKDLWTSKSVGLRQSSVPPQDNIAIWDISQVIHALTNSRRYTQHQPPVSLFLNISADL